MSRLSIDRGSTNVKADEVVATDQNQEKNATIQSAQTPRQKADAAKEKLEKAKEDQRSTEEEVSSKQATVDQLRKDADKALADQERAQADVDSKFQDLNDAAKNDVIQKKTSYDDAVKKRKEAEQKLSDLQNADLLYQKALDAYNKSKAELLKSNQDVDAELQALKAAENELLNAKKALEDAKRAVADKQNAYDDSKNKAEFDLEVTRQQDSLRKEHPMLLTTYEQLSGSSEKADVKTKELPQMGETKPSVSVLGTFLIMLSGIIGMFGLATKKKES